MWWAIYQGILIDNLELQFLTLDYNFIATTRTFTGTETGRKVEAINHIKNSILRRFVLSSLPFRCVSHTVLCVMIVLTFESSDR